MIRADEAATVVSVVIPCYAQAEFLPAAIESAVRQTHRPVEVVVVDDGSPAPVRHLVEAYPGVRYIRQDNQGRSAARNNGARASSGEFIVFLDADDRLRPDAIEVGVRSLLNRPDAAFTSGTASVIDASGAVVDERCELPLDGDLYRALLLGNYIATPGAAMFRRRLFEAIGGFDSSLHASEDYDLYLRMARRFPVCFHGAAVVEKRRHAGNTTSSVVRSLPWALAVIRRHGAAIGRDDAYWQAYRLGKKSYITRYGYGAAVAAAKHGVRAEWREAWIALKLLIREPRCAWSAVGRIAQRGGAFLRRTRVARHVGGG